MWTLKEENVENSRWHFLVEFKYLWKSCLFRVYRITFMLTMNYKCVYWIQQISMLGKLG